MNIIQSNRTQHNKSEHMDDFIPALAGPSKAGRLAALAKLEGHLGTDVLTTLKDIENVPVNLFDSRNKELHLENLLKLIVTQQPEETEIVAFHHLLGTLYINFEKFWGPTVRILQDFLKISKIRNRLLDHLTSQLIRINEYIYSDDNAQPEDLTNDRPDHVLHRNFILQLLAKFPEYVEANSAPFMDQLFLFAQKELLMSPFIEKFSRQDLAASNGPRQRGKLGVQRTKETMITMFRIVQSFQNISVIHRQEEFKDLIYDLLVCRDASVQKAAFNCLAVYNTQFIAPYMGKILKLLDEKKVRSELSNFSIGSEASHIQENHREKLVPIVHRILFGRMVSRIDKKSAGRAKADTRKSIVMRYISGCTVDEILSFFAILFDPIYDHIDVPYYKLEQRLRESIDVRHYIPLNKLQAMLSTLTAYLDTVAHQKDETLPHLLKLINIITYLVVLPLEDHELLVTIDTNCLATLKILRRSCLNIVTDFFQSTQYYKYSSSEINFIFKYVVWPSSANFVDRNHATVTPILKLINAFVQNEVYHHLLVKRNDEDENVYLLQLIMVLYNDSKIERPVSIYIARMIAKLLGIKSDDEGNSDEEDEVMECDQAVDVDHLLPEYDTFLYTVSSNTPIGLRMIMRYVPIIFDRLRATCEKASEKRDSITRLENCELQVLSTLSAHIKDSGQCMLAARLLLSTLENQKKATVIVSTLRTVQELMKHVEGPIDLKIIDYVADVLSYQRNIEQRKELSSLVRVLARVDDQLCSTSEAITLLNSTNENLVDVPDLERWSEGFRIAFEYLDGLNQSAMNDPNRISSLILLIHQIGYIINTVDKYEFSVRENCALFYDKLARKLILVETEPGNTPFTGLINEIILKKFIKKGLRETNDTIKHTYIGIVRTLAMICHEKNSILGEFFLFCDKNQDLDFWLNIRHIQLHNRSKALARLVANDNLQKVSPKTLSSYIMPLASGFMFNKAYKSVVSLCDNSIKLIGIICSHLNWVTYESTLSYYLGLLTKANTTYQRTCIKLITEIIKNFNFDMTACAEAMQYEDENKRLEKRMRRRCGGSGEDSSTCHTDASRVKRLNPSTARMVYYAVTKRLLPGLNSCLHEMTRVDFESDKNMANYLPEKDEIKRIPMAYAIVQLLCLLPGKYVLLRDNLPALFLKLITFLKSKNEQTRKAARATLLRIMLFVGPTYVPDMLRIMRQNLDKGFHVHVLNYTVHAVLSKLDLSYGDLDSSSYDIVEMSQREIFGQPSEDKEVAKVVAKTAEARKTTSYDTLAILATHISADKLSSVVESIKGLLKTASDPKTVNKLAVCIQKIWTGLAQNEQFPLDALLEFIRSSIEESLPNLRVRQQVDAAQDYRPQFAGALREDRFLLVKDKTKQRVKSKINEKGNLHMIVENSMRLLLSTFEKNKQHIKQEEALQERLDGFISLLTTCLKSSSPRCVTRSLKCLSFIAQTKIDLASFRTKANSIVRKIFILLSLYNGVGMVQGDNYEMIAMCFKTLTLLLLKCEHVHLEEKQIRALMSYIEQDLNDASRQATAFNALNSILHKKCESPELAEVMDKVADLLVTSSDDSVRSLSIKIWQTYLLEYKHDASKLQAHLAKFLRQIDYEYVDGRKSVLRMLQVIVEKFPEQILRNHFELFFHLLAQRVLNDDSKEVRAIVGRLIELLLRRLPETQEIVLIKFVTPWSSSSNLELKTLGVKLTSILIETNTETFDKNTPLIGRLNNILKILLEALGYKSNEKLAYHALRLFKRLIKKEIIDCTDARHLDHLRRVWQNIATDKLTHHYEPVVLTACELYLMFISRTQLSQALVDSNSTSDDYINRNATRIVRLLCDRFVELMDKYNPENTICKYAMQGLIMLGQMVANSNATLEFERRYTESFADCDVLSYLLTVEELPNDGFVREHLPYQMAEAKKRVDLMWLSVKVIMQARKEAAMYRLSQNYRRDFVLRWLAAIAQELGSQRIAPYVFLFLMTPVRELTDKMKNKACPDELVAQDLTRFIKGLVGVERFNKIYPKVQLFYTKKRIGRKAKMAISRVMEQKDVRAKRLKRTPRAS